MKFMKRGKRIKAAALATAAAFLIMTFAQTSFVFADDESDLSDILSGPGSGSVSLFGDSQKASSVEKEETVYIITNADGSKKDVIVSDHLKNGTSKKNIKDKSDLKDIENIKGDEKFSRETKNILDWAADGNDIYYQGKSNRALPVTLDIKYFLDDEEITGKNLQGRSGDVRILINYRNHTKTSVKVDGKSYNVCVPFIAMTGMILEDDNFSDVKVSSGKVINDGERQIVVGTALPGVRESLGLSKASKLPDKLEITARVKDFSLDYMMSVVTSNVFSQIDFSALNTGALDSGISTLDNAATQLVNGSDSLVKGLNKMYSSTGKMPGALEKLAKGAKKLKKGAETAYEGTGKLKDGADTLAGKVSELSEGLASITSGSVDLSSAASTLYKAIKNKIKPATYELADGASALDAGVDRVAEAVQSITDADSQALDYINSALEDPNLDEQTKQNLEDAALYLEGSIIGQGELKSQFDDPTAEGTIKYGSSALNDGISELDTGIGIAGEEGSLADGAKKIADGASTLTSYMGTAAEGGSKLSEGADKLASSTGTLQNGQKKIKNGAAALSKGASTISSKVPQLVSGLSKLASGSEKLSAGMSQLYQQGIKKLVDIYNGNIKGAANKLRAMAFAAKGYKVFTKLARGMNGSVKFIYKTDPSDGTAKDE